MTTFTTRVAGIPCQCRVTLDYTPPELTPVENFEFELLDRTGYRAPWLERKIDSATVDQLHSEYLDYLFYG